jgi:hypothetical protein
MLDSRHAAQPWAPDSPRSFPGSRERGGPLRRTTGDSPVQQRSPDAQARDDEDDTGMTQAIRAPAAPDSDAAIIRKSRLEAESGGSKTRQAGSGRVTSIALRCAGRSVMATIANLSTYVCSGTAHLV